MTLLLQVLPELIRAFSSCLWIQRSPNGPFQRPPSPLNNISNKESKSLALSPGLLKSDNWDAIFPLWKSVHDPAFHWVAVDPLPELGWIAWNKLQSPFKERGRGGGLWGGVGNKGWEDQSNEGQRRGSDKAEGRVWNSREFLNCGLIICNCLRAFHAMSLHPAPGLRVALRQRACAASERDRSDPFVCFPNPGFAEID